MNKYTGKIENMPMGATLTGIVIKERELRVRYPQRDIYSPEVIDRSYMVKPDKIEVHDDVFCLLTGGNQSWGRDIKIPGLELNIKRGTLVEWEI